LKGCALCCVEDTSLSAQPCFDRVSASLLPDWLLTAGATDVSLDVAFEFEDPEAIVKVDVTFHDRIRNHRRFVVFVAYLCGSGYGHLVCDRL
jgi:hypothetical protein